MNNNLFFIIFKNTSPKNNHPLYFTKNSREEILTKFIINYYTIKELIIIALEGSGKSFSSAVILFLLINQPKKKSISNKLVKPQDKYFSEIFKQYMQK
jgi:hypothetical protein